MDKRKNFIKIMCEVAIMAALGFVIDGLQSAIFRGVFTAGGSIGFALVAVWIMSYRRGFVAGLCTGAIMALLDVATGASMIASSIDKVILQVTLDYLLAYPLASLAGLFHHSFVNAKEKKMQYVWIIVGCLVGGLAKYASHFLSGILFYADPTYFVWPIRNAWLYSLLYNGAYTIPCVVLSGAIMVVVFWKAPRLFLEPNRIYQSAVKTEEPAKVEEKPNEEKEGE
ncbi:MAG: energy-coupled thiamine transporter ThiT [Bacilli bacterium]|nr:energy-coupled thiamine transporter ThiT [Bacilli bacterium]